jgi:integrase
MNAATNVLEMPAPLKQKRKPARARRPKGTGSLYKPKFKDASGRICETHFFWAKYKVKGVCYRVNTHCTTRQAAQDFLAKHMASAVYGTETTLHTLLEMARDSYKLQGRRSTDKQELAITRLEDFFGPNTKADEITASKVDEYQAHRLKEKNTDIPTVSRELACLKFAFRLGLKKERVAKVPHIAIPSEEHRARDGEFTPAQFAGLVANLPEYLRPVAEFIYRTGMRIMEPLAMQWEEVILERQALRLPGRRTKNGEAKPLPLEGKILEIVKEQRRLRDEKFPDCPFVFFDEEGAQIPYDRSSDAFQRAAKAAKVSFREWNGEPRNPGWHDLRRTFARNAKRAGLSLDEIKRLGGWKSLAMVLRYCGDGNEDEQRAGIARMDSFLAADKARTGAK